MRTVHHIQISAYHHSSRYIWKITTRKAYARLKTSVFLRSVNVKDSMDGYFETLFFIEHSFQPRTPGKVIHTPICGVEMVICQVFDKYRGGVLIKHFRNLKRVNVFESLNLVTQC